MKSKIIKLALLSLFVSQSITVANAQSLSKNSGALTFIPNEFSPDILNYPTQVNGSPVPWRARFNETKPDRMFMHTFQFKIPRRCKVKKANFAIKVKNLGAQNGNDRIGFMNGPTSSLYSQKVWYTAGQGLGFTKVMNFNLANLPQGANLGQSRPFPSILNTLNDGKFSIYLQDDTSVQSVRLDYQLSGKNCNGKPGDGNNGKPKKGMTWKKKAVDPITGVVSVACKIGGFNCNPYKGDLSCAQSRPILCKRELNLPKPASVPVPNQYMHWSKNVVGTTRPVSPASAGLTTLSKANQYCAAEFGKGWKVATFHDGKHWGFSAYGNAGTKAKRFWVNIRDQANGNCWSQQ